MTEEEWLSFTDSNSLAVDWTTRFSERKARLFMLACCRRHEGRFANGAVRRAAAVLARHYADPTIPDAPFDGAGVREAYARAKRQAMSLCVRKQRKPYQDDRETVAGVACSVAIAVEPSPDALVHDPSFGCVVHGCLNGLEQGLLEEEWRVERAAQADLAREVLGIPFRRVEVPSTWRTDTTVAIARQMYATEDFSALPILADALQDAGCENADVLDHCRGDGLHVRGCWVVDLVLGKE